MKIKLEFPDDNFKCPPIEMEAVPRAGEFIVFSDHEFPIERVVYEVGKYDYTIRLDLGQAQELLP